MKCPSSSSFCKASGRLPLPDHSLISPFSSLKRYLAFLTPPLAFRPVLLYLLLQEQGVIRDQDLKI